MHEHSAHHDSTTATPTPLHPTAYNENADVATDSYPEVTDIADGIAIKPDNSEYRVYATLKTDGTVDSYQLVQVSDFDAWEKSSTNVGKQLAFAQTIRKYKVGTVEGFLKLIGDEEEAIAIINRGINQKLSQKLNTMLLETNEAKQLVFEPTDSVFDTRELLQEPTKRKSLSPIEKLQRDVKKAGFSEDQLRAMIAALQSVQS